MATSFPNTFIILGHPNVHNNQCKLQPFLSPRNIYYIDLDVLHEKSFNSHLNNYSVQPKQKVLFKSESHFLLNLTVGFMQCIVELQFYHFNNN